MPFTHPLAVMAAVNAVDALNPRPRSKPNRLHVELRVFLAEHYAPAVNAVGVDTFTARLDSAAASHRRRGIRVHLLGCAGVPDDDSLLTLFAASSVDVVARTIEQADLSVERILVAFWRTNDR